MKKQSVIKVLKVEPDKAPELIEMENNLETMQAIVGGYIEVYPLGEGVDIVCNEEGKLNGLELNRPIYYKGELVDIIAGTFFIAGIDFDSGDFASLTLEQIAKYGKEFQTPVHFVKVGGEIIAVPR